MICDGKILTAVRKGRDGRSSGEGGVNGRGGGGGRWLQREGGCCHALVKWGVISCDQRVSLWTVVIGMRNMTYPRQGTPHGLGIGMWGQWRGSGNPGSCSGLPEHLPPYRAGLGQQRLTNPN